MNTTYFTIQLHTDSGRKDLCTITTHEDGDFSITTHGQTLQADMKAAMHAVLEAAAAQWIEDEETTPHDLDKRNPPQ